MTTIVRQCGGDQDAEIFESFDDFKMKISKLSKEAAETEYDNSMLVNTLKPLRV